MGTLVTGARIFDGERIGDADSVLIDGERIAAVGRSLPPSDAHDVVDAAGCTLLPGLLDAHVHTPFPYSVAHTRTALAQAARFGVTELHCMGGDATVVRDVSADPRPGEARIRTAGVVATVAGSHPTQLFGGDYPTLEGVDDVPGFIAARVAEGASWVKLMLDDGSVYGRSTPCVSAELATAVVEEAHRHGLAVVAHAQSRALWERALDAGVDGLAHQFVDIPTTPDIAARVAEQGVFVVLTLAVYFADEGRRLADDPSVAPLLDEEGIEVLRMGGDDSESHRTNGLGAVATLRDAGVRILAGTDAANPGTAYGASLHDELGLLVRGGLSPLDALRSATSRTADAFRSTGGRIREGGPADLLLVEGDPTRDIAALADRRGAWVAGSAVARVRVDG